MVAEVRPPQESHPIAAPGDDAPGAWTLFVADAHAVAEAIDPLLAGLLAAILGRPPGEDPRASWRGDRRGGLELCRRLLLYVRDDIPDRRLDVILGYIAGELGRIDAASRSSAAH